MKTSLQDCAMLIDKWLWCSIQYSDTVNVHVSKYSPQYKSIRNVKNIDEPVWQHDFLCLLRSLVCGLESINHKLSMLNSLITEYINRLASLRSIKVIYPYAASVHWKEIRALQGERSQHTAKARDDNNHDPWLAFRAVKNYLKSCGLSSSSV